MISFASAARALRRTVLVLPLVAALGACGWDDEVGPKDRTNVAVISVRDNRFTVSLDAANFTNASVTTVTQVTGRKRLIVTVSDYSAGTAAISLSDAENATIFSETFSANNTRTISGQINMPSRLTISGSGFTGKISVVVENE